MGAARACLTRQVRQGEPIALKFESGKAFLAGKFPELEAELRGRSRAVVTMGQDGRRIGRTRWSGR